MSISQQGLQVLGLLGEGGMVTVELVADAAGHRFARKCLRPGVTATSSALAFRREFYTLATLHHPNIVKALEFGTNAQGCWYTMEYVEGQTLAEVEDLSWREICKLLRQVVSALDLLHGLRRVPSRTRGSRHNPPDPRSARATRVHRRTGHFRHAHRSG